MGYDAAIAACGDYERETVRRALEEVLEPVGGLDWVRPGMRIGVKLNLVTLMRPEQAATTHPVLAAELSRMLIARGAEVTLGDSPGGPWNSAYVSGVYAAAGLRLAEEAGARLNRDFRTREASFPQGVKARRFPYTAWLDDCDAVIDFCKLKTHGLTAMSGAVKNLFGVIPGTSKPEFHYLYPAIGDFSNMLVDLNEFVRPRLTLVDAVTCMEGNGPTQGTPRHLGALAAARTPYAADLLCAELIGLSGRVETVKAAAERGLCPARVEDLAVSGDWRAFAVEDFETLPARDVITFETHSALIRQVLQRSFQASPAVERSRCVRCGKCREVCPMDAVTLADRGVEIDREKCIRCFCCQEFCPVGAMRVRRPLLARVLSK